MVRENKTECKMTFRNEEPHVNKVFPACAGMFRRIHVQNCAVVRFPRVRGDVPPTMLPNQTLRVFSPRARGCSPNGSTLTLVGGVFPACAGMFLVGTRHVIRSLGFPRVRGDVPDWYSAGGDAGAFSPRARGCSRLGHRLARRQRVFPACAGMFPTGRRVAHNRTGFPRVRGDVPLWCVMVMGLSTFSPRARGCSRRGKPVACPAKVFPACAGMFRPESPA